MIRFAAAVSPSGAALALLKYSSIAVRTAGFFFALLPKSPPAATRVTTRISPLLKPTSTAWKSFSRLSALIFSFSGTT